DLTAMTFHYETQPIPNPVAFYAHHLPLWWNKASTALTLGIELFVPWLIIGPRRARPVVAAFLAGLQLLIALTGNFAFFNLLAIALCVFLIDDDAWLRIARRAGLKPCPTTEVAQGSSPANLADVAQGFSPANLADVAQGFSPANLADVAQGFSPAKPRQ